MWPRKEVAEVAASGGAGEIRRRRLVLGESQREAARRLGIPTYTLAALESGEKPRIASAARLVAAARVLYGVPVEAWLEQGPKERRRA